MSRITTRCTPFTETVVGIPGGGCGTGGFTAAAAAVMLFLPGVDDILLPLTLGVIPPGGDLRALPLPPCGVDNLLKIPPVAFLSGIRGGNPPEPAAAADIPCCFCWFFLVLSNRLDVGDDPPPPVAHPNAEEDEEGRSECGSTLNRRRHFSARSTRSTTRFGGYGGPLRVVSRYNDGINFSMSRRTVTNWASVNGRRCTRRNDSNWSNKRVTARAVSSGSGNLLALAFELCRVLDDDDDDEGVVAIRQCFFLSGREDL